jgi:hypothetical protein
VVPINLRYLDPLDPFSCYRFVFVSVNTEPAFKKFIMPFILHLMKGKRSDIFVFTRKVTGSLNEYFLKTFRIKLVGYRYFLYMKKCFLNLQDSFSKRKINIKFLLASFEAFY